MRCLYAILSAALLFQLSTCSNIPAKFRASGGKAGQKVLSGAAADLGRALRHVVSHTAGVVSVEEILREAETAKDIYFKDFVPAIRSLKSQLQTKDDEETSDEEYSSQIVQELRTAINKVQVSKDQILVLLLGEEPMEADGVLLRTSLRLLSTLVQRFQKLSDMKGLSLSAVREVSAVADAAMEALQGVTRAAQHAQKDAETIQNAKGDTGKLTREGRNRTKRGAPYKIRLGGGFSINKGGLLYERGGTDVHFKPSFSGYKVSGFAVSVRFRF